MTLKQKVASALSFAHIAGIRRKASASEDDAPEKDPKDPAAEDDERKQREDESAEEYAARMEELDERDDDKDDKQAANDDPDDDGDVDDGSGPNKDAEDDDPDEMAGKSAAAQARRRERARCVAILGSSAAARNPELATHFAFETTMTRKQALAALNAALGRAPSAAHAGRAARNPRVGSEGAAPTRGQALAARWDQNLQAAGGSKMAKRGH